MKPAIPARAASVTACACAGALFALALSLATLIPSDPRGAGVDAASREPFTMECVPYAAPLRDGEPARDYATCDMSRETETPSESAEQTPRATAQD